MALTEADIDEIVVPYVEGYTIHYKFFAVFEDLTYDDKPYLYTRIGITSTVRSRVVNYLIGQGEDRMRYPARWGFVAAAQNETVLKMWLRKHGHRLRDDKYLTPGEAYNTALYPPLLNRTATNPHMKHTHIKEQDMNVDNAIKSKKNRIKQLKKEIKVLKNRPQEPVATEGMPNIIQFEKRFIKGGRLYEYAAIQANGKWYTTGPRSPKGYPWAELVTWMYDGWTGTFDPIPDGIFVVTGLEEI